MKTLSLITLLVFALNVSGQIASPALRSEKTDWWGDIEGFLNRQSELSLGMASEALKTFPPSIEENLTRKMALMLIDNVLHEEKAPYLPAVQSFLNKRIGDAVDEIKTEKVITGAVIWKLYNHTFIIKTPSVTIGFDIQRGIPRIPGFSISNNITEKLISEVDILFISHQHDDHADQWVAEKFIEQNKPVVAPPGLWEGSPLYSKLMHPARIVNKKDEILLPEKGIKLSYITFPGHQGETVLNNVYLVFTPEGFSFSHTGDQSFAKDFEWIDKIGDNFKVDVVMTNSWSSTPELRLAKGYRPRLIISAHENELGHTIDHREPYWLNEIRLGDKSRFPWIQMAWGEKYSYPAKTNYTTLNGHAHNDYLNEPPFMLAYNNHFGSVEADIWAEKGELLVAHSKAETKPERTIESLYLNPVSSCFEKNNGRAWSDNNSSFELLIDLKTPVDPTLGILIEKLKKDPLVFDPYANKNAVQIVITGNRPEPVDFIRYPDFIFFDGLPGTVYNEEQLKRIALFSDNLRNYTLWNGEGNISEKDLVKIKNVIETVHSLNKKIRFWNAPDNAYSWKTLMDLGVDYINTDHIAELSAFLKESR